MLLRDVGKSYRPGKWILTNVDADLPPGERIALQGGNGSGKSTLLRIMAGVTRPSAGRVEDRPRDIGYVPERFPSHERMSARAYLTHMGRIRGLTTHEATRRGDHLLSRLALVGGANSPLRTLSKGNAQKVAFAQAWIVPPRLLVLDEPWSGLDRSAHDLLVEIMQETVHNGGTVVFTDHRESVVRANATRVYHVANGKVVLGETSPSSTPPQETELVLRSPLDEHGVPRALDWLAFDGVLTAHTDTDRVVVRALAEHTDQLVLFALHDGWSLIAVSRGDSSQGAHRSPR